MTSRANTAWAFIGNLMTVVVLLVGMGTAEAKIAVPAGAAIEVDESTVNAVVAVFERAEQAIKAHDLEMVMAAYASQY
ncbi:MAG: hypothetical protein ACT4O4_06360, partial [Nitrospiraceae bacterium]